MLIVQKNTLKKCISQFYANSSDHTAEYFGGSFPMGRFALQSFVLFLVPLLD